MADSEQETRLEIRGHDRSRFVAKPRRLADAVGSERASPIHVAGERLRIPATAVFDIDHERSVERRQAREFQLSWASEEPVQPFKSTGSTVTPTIDKDEQA